jgi:hypothetical protein
MKGRWIFQKEGSEHGVNFREYWVEVKRLGWG